MHHTVAVASLFLLAAAPPRAPTAEEFFARVQAPVSLDDVAVETAVNGFKISFRLQEVGPVSIIVDADDGGSGRGLVTVRGTVVAEVGFVDGLVVREESDFSALIPAEVQAVVASLLQVWHEDAVRTDLLHSRDLKCWWAGKIAGGTIGLAVFSGCGLVTKSPTCYGWGTGAGAAVAGYITNKCNGAQNG